MKLIYYWMQMRFARRAWISTNRTQAMRDMHSYYRKYINEKRSKDSYGK